MMHVALTIRTSRVAMCVTVAAVLMMPGYATAVVGLHAHHSDKHADQKLIVDMEHRWRDALLTADSIKLEKLLADDFLGISANGMLSNKGQYLQKIGSRRYSFTRLDFDDMKVRLRGELAVVTALVKVEGQLDDEPQKGIFRYTRVYRMQPGIGWKVINFEATRVSRTPEGAGDLRNGTPLQSLVR